MAIGCESKSPTKRIIEVVLYNTASISCFDVLEITRSVIAVQHRPIGDLLTMDPPHIVIIKLAL